MTRLAWLAIPIIGAVALQVAVHARHDTRLTRYGKEMKVHNTAKATFGAGCFWGVEAAFRQVPGVVATTVGYTGGTLPNPTYQQVCAGGTGHTEAVEVTYDPAKVTYDQLLDVFFRAHDPTVPTKAQYKSVIFYHTPEQRTAAAAALERLRDSKASSSPIATELISAQTFYPAEEYHQQYYEKRGIQGACPA